MFGGRGNDPRGAHLTREDELMGPRIDLMSTAFGGKMASGSTASA